MYTITTLGLSAVEAHYWKTSTRYEQARCSAASSLLHVLQDSVEAGAELRRWLEAGEIPPGGFRKKKPI